MFLPERHNYLHPSQVALAKVQAAILGERKSYPPFTAPVVAAKKPTKRAPAKKPTPPAAPTARERVVSWARWGVENTAQIHYSEGPGRSDWLHYASGHLPMTTDCSGFATACYRWAGLPDPNGLGYRQLGYTGTLLSNATKKGRILVDITKALPGDLIVYGGGTGEHVAVIVEAGADPLTVSHGQESEPAFVRVSQDGREPQRICRYLP